VAVKAILVKMTAAQGIMHLARQMMTTPNRQQQMKRRKRAMEEKPANRTRHVKIRVVMAALWMARLQKRNLMIIVLLAALNPIS